MVPVTYARLVRCPVGQRLVQKLLAAIARAVPALQAGVSITVVGLARMRSINRRSRGLDRPTDVLSFAWSEGQSVPGATRELGELYLCYPYLIRQARRWGVPVKEEFARSLIHGLLHLGGFNHQAARPAARMFRLQEQLVGRVLHDFPPVKRAGKG